MSDTFWWDAEIDDAIFIIAAHLSGSPPALEKGGAREDQNQGRKGERASARAD